MLPNCRAENVLESGTSPRCLPLSLRLLSIRQKQRQFRFDYKERPKCRCGEANLLGHWKYRLNDYGMFMREREVEGRFTASNDHLCDFQKQQVTSR